MVHGELARVVSQGGADGDIYQCLTNDKAIRMAQHCLGTDWATLAKEAEGGIASHQAHQACPQPVIFPLAHFAQSSSGMLRANAGHRLLLAGHLPVHTLASNVSLLLLSRLRPRFTCHLIPRHSHDHHQLTFCDYGHHRVSFLSVPVPYSNSTVHSILSSVITPHP